MASFEQFRSTFPENSNEKGEAFEVFLAEWMFKNHPSLASQFKKVWRFSDWPNAWSHQDLGTDLIAEDQHGKTCAIQAKFYKETSSIPKSHIDSFLSDSNRPEVDYRLLIATTDGLGSNAIKTIEGQEKEVQSFLLHNFLEPFDWPESLDSLETYKPRKPHKPRPHQQAAIDDVCKHIDGRGQLLMACGTGKTLTGQRISEKLESECTLVLLPSLLLLSKTVADWVSESEADFIYLPVCSDSSATKKTDEAALANSELCFRATTDSAEIAQFLQRPERKVIFSTYQSSPQIAEAFKQHSLKPFDLIIADEAHRCAGKVSSDYSTVLSEDLIPATNRLFMTATPRMYTSRIKKKAKDAEIEIASMDDESVFGPVLHHLTFGQAIANDPPLLTDYRVLVVGVNDEMCKQMVEERAFIRTESGLVDDAQSIASQLGLSKAIKDYDLKRVISFHSRVNYAKNFANSFQELQEDLKAQHKPSGTISYSHVSGAMPTSERTKELRALGALENEDRYIVGNARCLSEGVDVPALDGVAFVDPRRSEIDIIQAVGRAIRLSEGKETGTIVIPVFISDEDDPDEVLSSSQFDQVWKVVNALRSHDESLGEMLDHLRVGLGRKRKVSFKDTKIVFDVPTKVSEDFVEAFETKLVETTTAAWEFGFGVLSKYSEENGTAEVPAKGCIVDAFNLSTWCDTQRVNYAAGRLSQQRIEKLNSLLSLGWKWSLKDSQREANIAILKEYYDLHGHTLVKEREKDEQRRNVGVIKKGLIQARSAGTLEARHIDYLTDELDFIWEGRDRFFFHQDLAAISDWAQTNGSCVPPKNTKVSVRISKTVKIERNIELFRNRAVKQYRYHVLGQKYSGAPPRKLSLDEIHQIEQIPHWFWDTKDEQWMKFYRLLLQFVEREGNPHVPANNHKEWCDVSGKFEDLSDWMRRQRARFDAGKLKENRIALLTKIKDFDWSGKKSPKRKKFQLDEGDFENRLAYLRRFISLYGHAVVKQDVVFEGFPLGVQVSRWRSAFFGKDRRALTSDQIEKLEQTHPTWLWSAADARDGLPYPLEKSTAAALLRERPNHDINRVIQFGLYAGFRMHDVKNFSVVNEGGVFCFSLPQRSGYQKRLIPISAHLSDISTIAKSTGSLGNMFRKLKPVTQQTGPVIFNSLHMSFREQLKKNGLSSQSVNRLSGWHPDPNWDTKELRAAHEAINAISYT